MITDIFQRITDRVENNASGIGIQGKTPRGTITLVVRSTVAKKERLPKFNSRESLEKCAKINHPSSDNKRAEDPKWLHCAVLIFYFLACQKAKGGPLPPAK